MASFLACVKSDVMKKNDLLESEYLDALEAAEAARIFKSVTHTLIAVPSI